MKHAYLLLTVAASIISLSACSQSEEGSAEKAGKKIDEMVQDAKSYTEEKVHEAGEAIEKAGEEMQKDN